MHGPLAYTAKGVQILANAFRSRIVSISHVFATILANFKRSRLQGFLKPHRGISSLTLATISESNVTCVDTI